MIFLKKMLDGTVPEKQMMMSGIVIILVIFIGTAGSAAVGFK